VESYIPGECIARCISGVGWDPESPFDMSRRLELAQVHGIYLQTKKSPVATSPISSSPKK